MTKILVLSDLHLEFGSLVVPETEADVVVLAGDIHVGAEAARWSGRLSKRLGVPVVLIAGNHEHYSSLSRDVTFGGTLATLRSATASSAGNLIFLECDSATIAGVRFLGCTLWTDFELYGAPREAMAYAKRSMTDFWTIANRTAGRFTPDDSRDEFKRALKFLEVEFAKPFDKPTVVVTHHLPSMKSVADRFKDDMLTAAYASHLDNLVAGSGAALWVHGHTHDSCDYVLGSTRVVCNPRGYQGIALNRRFNPKLVVEVGVSGQKVT